MGAIAGFLNERWRVAEAEDGKGHGGAADGDLTGFGAEDAEGAGARAAAAGGADGGVGAAAAGHGGETDAGADDEDGISPFDPFRTNSMGEVDRSSHGRRV